jgi:putative restriction endonuclease
MNGYVANTDFDWYSFLAAQPPVEEVNFWQPGGGNQTFRALKPGEPFFFRLKERRNVIAGFGWFARHERNVRSSLAWDAFGTNNGAPDLETMRQRIRMLRTSRPEHPDDPDVGCLMIAQPTFFPPERWIAQPNDFQRNIVQGKTYDVTAGEGRRIFDACIAAAAGKELSTVQGTVRIGENKARYGAPTPVRPRLGQGIFRVALHAAYEGACAVTREHSEPVLEAAHIQPYSQGGQHQVENGLLLRTDIHKLFDLGFVTVTTDHLFEVSSQLREEWNNGKTYYALRGQMIRLPKHPADRPAPALLAWHNDHVFRG